MIIYPTYIKHACQTLTGIWTGTAYDTTNLFGHSWPVTIKIVSRHGHVFGKIKLRNKRMQHTLQHRFWADCHSGLLTNTLLQEPIRKCGDTAAPSVLVTKNLLLLYIHWENAMIGDQFLLTLKRGSQQLSTKQLHQLVVVKKPFYRSCH